MSIQALLKRLLINHHTPKGRAYHTPHTPNLYTFHSCLWKGFLDIANMKFEIKGDGSNSLNLFCTTWLHWVQLVLQRHLVKPREKITTNLKGRLLRGSTWGHVYRYETGGQYPRDIGRQCLGKQCTAEKFTISCSDFLWEQRNTKMLTVHLAAS